MDLNNPKMAGYEFLAGMYADNYFPKGLVDRVKAVLIQLCARIEDEKPADAEAMLELTHAAVEQINDLKEDFEEKGSELETEAGDAIGDDFRHIVESYGFEDL